MKVNYIIDGLKNVVFNNEFPRLDEHVKSMAEAIVDADKLEFHITNEVVLSECGYSPLISSICYYEIYLDKNPAVDPIYTLLYQPEDDITIINMILPNHDNDSFFTLSCYIMVAPDPDDDNLYIYQVIDLTQDPDDVATHIYEDHRMMNTIIKIMDIVMRINKKINSGPVDVRQVTPKPEADIEWVAAGHTALCPYQSINIEL